MTSRGFGLPASVVLFGTIYAIALAFVPGKSSAALQSERAHGERQIVGEGRPIAHAPRGRVSLESLSLRPGATHAGPTNDLAQAPQQSKPGGN
jgi:hypothetical protein